MQARELCDGMAKALYGKVFEWLQLQVNRALSVRAAPLGSALGEFSAADADVAAESSLLSAAPLFCGVLDIFGFECFERNSLEQLCINYANEALQGVFNRVMVIAAQEEYEREGILAASLDFSGLDNVDGRALIDHKQTGLFALIEEECQARCTRDTPELRPRFHRF